MANPNLRMTIEAQTKGEQNISNLEAAINRLISKIDTLGKKSEESNNRTSASFKSLATQLSSVFSGDVIGGASRGLQTLVTAFAGASVAASGAIEVFKQFASAASDLTVGQARLAREQVNFAQRLGVTTAEGLKFSAMAKIAGVDANALTLASRYVAAAIENTGQGSSRAREALQQLGVATRTQSGAARDLGAVTLDVIKALGNMDDVAKRVALSSELMGRGGYRELQPLLANFRDLSISVKQFGDDLNANGTEKLSQASEEINKMSEAWDLLKKKLAEKIAPIVITFAHKFVDVVGPDNGPQKNGILNSQRSWREDADRWLKQTLNELPGPTELAPRLSFDQAASTANAKRNQDASLLTPEGIEERITFLQQEVKKQRNIAGDTSVAVANQNAAARQATAYEAEIRSLQQRRNDIQQRPEIIRRLREEGGTPSVVARFQYANRLAKGTPEYNRALQELWAKQLTESQDRTQKFTDEMTRLKAQADAAGNAYSDLGPASRDARDFYSTLLYRPESVLNAGLPPPSAAITAARFSGETDYQQRLRAITARPGSEFQDSAKTLAEQKQLIARELQVKEDEIRGERDYVTEAGKLADARAEARNKELDAENQYNLAIAQITENRKNAFRESVQGGFEALVGGGDEGLGRYLRGRITSVGTTIAGNAADMAYGTFGNVLSKLPGQIKTDARGKQTYTWLGSLLRGTSLGADLKGGGKSLEIASTDLNTKSTDLNTQAVGALYTALTGQTLPGIPTLSSGAVSGPSSGISPSAFGPVLSSGSSTASIISSLGATVSKAGLPQVGGAIQSAASVAGLLSSTLWNSSSGAPPLGTLDTSIATEDDTGSSTKTLSSVKSSLSRLSKAAASASSSGNSSDNSLFSDLSGSNGKTALVGAIAKLGAAGVGAVQGISQITKGGAKNVSTGLGETLLSAGALTGNPFIVGAGAVASLVGALLPDERAARQHNIERALFEDKSELPTSLDVTASAGGTYSDFGIGGFVRSSGLSPFPSVTNPYVDLPRRTVVPGHVISQYGAGAAPTVAVTVQTMDAKSFQDNANKITDAVHTAITRNGHPIINALRQQL